MFMVLALAAAVSVATYGPAYAQSADEPVTVYVGVLTPGSAIEAAAITQSIQDVNDILELTGAEWRLEAVYPDGSTSLAEFIAESQEDGVMAFVGPGDTVNLLRAKEAIANTGYNAVYVGCCVPATHHDVLGSDNNVFVLAPDVLDQAAAVAAAMEAAGIDYAIPVYSGDLQSSHMRASIAAQFDGVMDSGVLVPLHTLDYSPVVSVVAGKVESANGKAAVLVLEPDATGGLMAAGSALADVAWFGTSSASGLPSLDGAAADFAESVGYVVPKFGSLHEPRLMVNLLYTQEAWSAYEAVQIAAYSLSNPTADFVPFFGRWTPMPVQAPPVSDAEALATALPLYAAAYGGGTGSAEMNANGGLASASHLLYGMADGTWVKEAVYNPSVTTIVGRTTNGHLGDFVYLFEPTHRLHDVHTVGALLPLSGSLGGPAEQRLTAARVATSVINELNDGYGNDWYVDLLIEDTQTDPDVALEKLKKMDRLGVKMVVGPSSSASAAAVREYAHQNDIVLLSPSTSHALSIPGDSLYRVSPPSIHEVTVLTNMLERDGTEYVVAIYREDLWGGTLVEGLLSEFGGTINTENGYSPELANEGILDYERIAADVAEDVLALVEEHGESTVAVMMIGFEESADILEAASLHPVLGSVQWYGSAGNANRLAIPANDAALAFAESVDFKGPILMLDDGIAAQVAAEYLIVLHIGEHLDPYSYVTYDAVLTAGFTVGNTAGLPASEVGPILGPAIGNTVNFIAGDGGLDENGDLAGADYDIWQIKDGRWHNILVYDSDREKFLREVTVGVPTPFSGIHANSFPQRTAVYWLAEIVTNEVLARQDADWRLVMESQDTAGDPQRALQVVKSMHERGINLLLGPPDTASLEAVRQYVDENNMLALSCCSTGTDLALPDRIFRLAPDDTREAEALNALFEEHATGHLITAYRDDAFGSSLNRAVTETFGGNVVEIHHRLLDYGSLSAQIAGAVQAAGERGESGVAVLLIGYGESADIMASASEHHILGSVKWYGTSGVAKQLAVTTNLASAAFAEMVNYEATLFAEPPPDPFVVGGLASVHFIPDAYTYATYDAVALLAAAVEAAGSDDAVAIATVLPQVASQYPGTLGSLALNANGDLDQYAYDVWHV
ncbi:MAG: ABC transporter substrate-binding protein, partial [Nitrosopumilaceae archaeon]|nr:ABC transporter substrate-binding protein [Nitrosopumilaceae archaeon]